MQATYNLEAKWKKSHTEVRLQLQRADENAKLTIVAQAFVDGVEVVCDALLCAGIALGLVQVHRA